MGRVLEPRRIERVVLGEPIPGFEHEPSRAIFAKGSALVLLKHAEGLARVIRAHDLLRVEDVAQFVA